jgi:DNA mismatch repair protein MutS
LLPGLAARLQDSPSELLAGLGREMDPLDDVREELDRVLAEDPPALFGPGVIRSGCDGELDEARRLAFGAKEVLGELEARERAATGIGGLKIRFNRVFGYGLEVPRAHSARVPESWIRRQTLTSAERFTTPELEELERRISGAEAAAAEREQALFAELQLFAADRAARLAVTARAAAVADVLAAFADRARRLHYVQPRLVSGATQSVALAAALLGRTATLWFGEVVGGVALAIFLRDPAVRRRALETTDESYVAD